MRVELRDGEGFDQLFRRFTKGIERSGVIREHRHPVRNYTRKHIALAEFQKILEDLSEAGTPTCCSAASAMRLKIGAATSPP